jgi:hypothetical protein
VRRPEEHKKGGIYYPVSYLYESPLGRSLTPRSPLSRPSRLEPEDYLLHFFNDFGYKCAVGLQAVHSNLLGRDDDVYILGTTVLKTYYTVRSDVVIFRVGLGDWGYYDLDSVIREYECVRTRRQVAGALSL